MLSLIRPRKGFRSSDSTQSKLSPAELRCLWAEAMERNPAARAGDIAAGLGVTEAELLASRVGQGSIRLRPSWHNLLSALKTLGPVRAITHNDHAVIERECVYPDVEAFDSCSMLRGVQLDLCAMLSRWAFGFANETLSNRTRGATRGLHFFAENGFPVHQVLLTPESDTRQFYTLVAEFQASHQADHQEVAIKSQKHSTTMQWGERVFVRKVSNRSLELLLKGISKAELPVAVLLGNIGCLQTYRGLLRTIVDRRGWLNARDSNVEINIKEASVAQAWVATRPSPTGQIYSLETFDSSNAALATITAEQICSRNDEIAWQGLLSTLPPEGIPA